MLSSLILQTDDGEPLLRFISLDKDNVTVLLLFLSLDGLSWSHMYTEKQ